MAEGTLQQNAFGSTIRQPGPDDALSAHEADDDYDHLYKVVLVGDAGVGKTHLLSQYIKGALPKGPGGTIGVEFAERTVALAAGGTVKAQFWDTAGREKYRA